MSAGFSRALEKPALSCAIAQMETQLAWESLEDAFQTRDLTEMTDAVHHWWHCRAALRELLIEAGAA
jgi:hypothetical protein